VTDGETSEAGSAAWSVQLPHFEGPLDLLLHLCQKHELQILDIPIGFITEKYLEYLAVMELMQLDVAAEYLVMAATLAHIKSKMLLPAPPPGQEDELDPEDEIDPREALIKRLLEYQKYKNAGEQLAARGVAGRDIFLRGAPVDESVSTGPAPLAEIPIFALVEAFQRVLDRSKVKLSHDIVADRISLTDRIGELSDLLKTRRRIAFDDERRHTVGAFGTGRGARCDDEDVGDWAVGDKALGAADEIFVAVADCPGAARGGIGPASRLG